MLSDVELRFCGPWTGCVEELPSPIPKGMVAKPRLRRDREKVVCIDLHGVLTRGAMHQAATLVRKATKLAAPYLVLSIDSRAGSHAGFGRLDSALLKARAAGKWVGAEIANACGVSLAVAASCHFRAALPTARIGRLACQTRGREFWESCDPEIAPIFAGVVLQQLPDAHIVLGDGWEAWEASSEEAEARGLIDRIIPRAGMLELAMEAGPQ